MPSLNDAVLKNFTLEELKRLKGFSLGLP